jgi:transposase
MEAIVPRCCGLDVHQASVVACVLIDVPGRKPRKETRTFGAMTRDLEALGDWLAGQGVTHVGMESTGVYWKPVHAVLEGRFELIVGNAHHIKAVPGRKTDVKDAEWIAELVRHGLVRASFVPPPDLRELRDLLRYRRTLVGAQASERNRALKLLESANIKLAGVATDVFGVSGMAMLRALLEGTATPDEMAELARGRMRRKLDALRDALDGRFDDHHRFLLGLHLDRLSAMEGTILRLDRRIDDRLSTYAEEHRLLMQIPGVDRLGAATIIAEIGVDMGVFGTDKRLAAWAGVCPANRESAGRRHAAGARQGNVHLKTALVTAAICAAKVKGSYFRDKYHRLKARRGAMRAAMAIAHKILVAAFHMLSKRVPFRELGDAYLDHRARSRAKGQLVRRLAALGFDVVLRPREGNLATP